MTPDERKTLMMMRLQHAFTPSYLEVIDDSAAHAGHIGAAGGAGHYRILITASQLNQLPRIAAHRAVYAVFADLIPQEIHALSISVV